MRNEKNQRVGDLNQKYEEEAKKVKICMDKIKQLGEYIRTAKKLLRINTEEGRNAKF